MRSVVFGLVIVGCAAGKNASAPKAMAIPAVEPAAATPMPSGTKLGGVAIEPLAAAAPALSIVKPGPDEPLPADGARGQSVVLDDGGFLDENPGSRITVVLDGDVVRDVADVRAPLTLGAIDPQGRDPGPGEHVLVAVAVGPRGDAARFGPARRIASASRRFFVGPPPRGRAAPSAPMLVFLAPRGTYNGAARAQSALLDFAILGEKSEPRASLSVFESWARGARPMRP